MDYADEIRMNLERITEEAKQNLVSPLKVSVLLKKIEGVAVSFRKEIELEAMEETSKWDGREDIMIDGAKIELKYRTNYSYKHDHEWQRLSDARKEREKLMKMALKQEIYDADGTLVEAPEVSQTGFLTFTIK